MSRRRWFGSRLRMSCRWMRSRLRVSGRLRFRSGLGMSCRGWLRSRPRMSRRCRFRSRLRMGCCRWLGSRLRMGCRRCFRRRARMSCGCRFGSRPRMSRGCRLIFARSSCRCFVLTGLILGRFILGSFVLSSLVLGRFILGRFVFSGLVLGRRSFVGRSRLLGCYHACAAKLACFRCCSDCRTALVHRCQEFVVGAGSVHVLGLHRCGRRVLSA